MRKSLEALGLMALAALVWVTCTALNGASRLPDRIPTHFDAAGKPNGWGSPSMLIVMPVIALAIYLLMSVVARFPSAFNYPVRVTPENLTRLQAVTLDMLAWLKTELACMFAVLQWAIIRSARSGEGHLLSAILPVSILIIFGTVGWHIVALFRAANAGAESRGRF
jgi:uncharacterized membrane protein